MKNPLLALFILMSTVGLSQIDKVTSNLLPTSFDSVQCTLWNIYFKELSYMQADGTEATWEDEELFKVKLSTADSELLIEEFSNDQSYAQNRALLNHYNLVMEFYENAKVSARIEISTLTGNIDIQNNLSDHYFRNKCGDALGETILNVIERYGFLEYLDDFDLEGISRLKEE